MVRMVAEQLAFVTTNPVGGKSRAACWPGTSCKWSGLTSGMRSGTSGSIRWLRALLKTGTPVRAQRSSTSPATSALKAENATSTPPVASMGSTTIAPTSSGTGVGRNQRHASE